MKKLYTKTFETKWSALKYYNKILANEKITGAWLYIQAGTGTWTVDYQY